MHVIDSQLRYLLVHVKVLMQGNLTEGVYMNPFLSGQTLSYMYKMPFFRLRNVHPSEGGW